MEHLIIGAGEVGCALEQLLPIARLRDIQPDPTPDPADVAHIAFPYTPGFASDVLDYQRLYNPGLVVVHSTVPVGTCDPHGWVHSPVRGRHPDLVDGLKTFTKHFGGKRAAEAAGIFQRLGIDVHTTPLAATTEAGKLWELTMYGVQVAMEKAVHAYCAEVGADYDVAYGVMAETYNDGYVRLGCPQFVRPVLEHVPGPVGGHCVVPGAAMLGGVFGDLVNEAGRQ